MSESKGYCAISIIINDFYNPFSTFYKNIAYNNLYQIGSCAARIKNTHWHISQTWKHHGKRNGNNPYKSGIEKEGNKCLAARTKRKISWMQKCIERHHKCWEYNKECSELFNFIGRIVELWEQRCNYCHDCSDYKTACYWSKDKLCICFFCFL